MKHLILALALAMPACTANQALESAPIIGNICEVADATLIDEKIVYEANVLYNVPAHAYVTALNNGQITPELKEMIKPKLVTMYSLLKAVRAAQGSANCDFNSMKVLKTEIMAMIPKEQ